MKLVDDKGGTAVGPKSALDAYLSDHLAGAAAGCEIARRITSAYDDPATVAELRALAAEIETDRQTLVEIRDRLGFARRPIRQAVGWIGEKLTRVKLSDPVTGDADLTRLMELETLEIGITGKIALWHALAATVAPEHLEGLDMEALARRGQRQRAIVECRRLEAAHAALDAA